jgi:large subunit ribosomal protein L17
LQLLGDKQAVQILFDDIAPRFADRHGGYTRVLRLAKPRLGDAGLQAIIEFVGVHDRETVRSERPSFGGDDEAESDSSSDAVTESQGSEEASSGGVADETKAE